MADWSSVEARRWMEASETMARGLIRERVERN
jgi:hypothetical protein